MGGLFIVLEGGEGAGKTTLVNRLSLYYQLKGYNVVVTREPGGCPEAEQIRNIIMNSSDLSAYAEIALFAAARKIHCDKVIEPALKDSNTIVICDRYIYSNYIYQGKLNDVLNDTDDFSKKVTEVNEALNIRMPDLKFFIDVKPKTGLARISNSNRKTNRFDDFNLKKHEIIYGCFKSMQNLTSIDGERDADIIARDLITIIDSRL